VSVDRRIVVGGLLGALGAGAARAQGFAGLGAADEGFAPVVPGRVLDFPRDHGPHPDFRIEWWYLTANVQDASGAAWGAQWTLFRQAMMPGADQPGWDSRQLWMGHAAVTGAEVHRYAEKFARGGVGQAGVEAAPFQAWIDDWQMRAGELFSANAIAPLEVKASGADFGYALKLEAVQPLVLQGEGGYSRKSERGQASYYYSQPYFTASGTIILGGRGIAVTGRAWMDREWSSQPLASDQTGWDWFSLHLDGGDKVMLFRLRQKDGGHYFAGNWIDRAGRSEALPGSSIVMTPTGVTDVAGRKVPTAWRLAVASRGLAIDCTPLNPQSWMGTRFAYWEGPIRFRGSHGGVGYLEMTGY
jgi:predicted secreted hydrolase